MAVYYEEQKYVASDELRSTLKNLPQKYTGRGAAVRRTDHAARDSGVRFGVSVRRKTSDQPRAAKKPSGDLVTATDTMYANASTAPVAAANRVLRGDEDRSASMPSPM